MVEASSTLSGGGQTSNDDSSGSNPARTGARRTRASHVVRLAVLASIGASVMVFGLVLPLSRRLIESAAEAAAVEHAGNVTAATTERALRPLLADGVLTADPVALSALDRAARELVGPEIEHVRIWNADGTILWSDEAQLIGLRFEVPDVHRSLLASEHTIARVSDLGDRHDPAAAEPEQRRLEVYYGTHTLGGVPVVIETYAPYELAARNAVAVRQRLIPLVVTMVGALAVAQAWLVFVVGGRLARSERRRAELVRLAAEASDAERRRLAAHVHDGLVQDLTAVSYALTAAANDAEHPAATRELHGLAHQTRAAVASMRDLISRIYPVEVPAEGWVAGLDDLIRVLERQGVVVDVSVDDRRLSHVHQLILLRITREALRNIARHANARNVRVDLVATRQRVSLSVTDDGDGFDAAAQPPGHFGLHLLRDLARDHGGRLDVESAPGAGTALHFRLAGTS